MFVGFECVGGGKSSAPCGVLSLRGFDNPLYAARLEMQVIVVICCGTAVTISLLRITEKNHSPSPDQGLGLTNGFAEYKDGDLGTRIRGTGSTKGHPGQNEGKRKVGSSTTVIPFY